MQQTDEFFLLIYHYSVQGKSAHETNSELLSISSPSNQYLQTTSIENCPQPLAVVQRASGGSSCLCRASGAHPDASQTGFLPVHFQLLTAHNERWGWYLEGLHFEQKAEDGWMVQALRHETGKEPWPSWCEQGEGSSWCEPYRWGWVCWWSGTAVPACVQFVALLSTMRIQKQTKKLFRAILWIAVDMAVSRVVVFLTCQEVQEGLVSLRYTQNSMDTGQFYIFKCSNSSDEICARQSNFSYLLEANIEKRCLEIFLNRSQKAAVAWSLSFP